jgi:hypothetical protein
MPEALLAQLPIKHANIFSPPITIRQPTACLPYLPVLCTKIICSSSGLSHHCVLILPVLNLLTPPLLFDLFVREKVFARLGFEKIEAFIRESHCSTSHML